MTWPDLTLRYVTFRYIAQAWGTFIHTHAYKQKDRQTDTETHMLCVYASIYIYTRM